MTANINRYSYTNFTGNPYIHNYGVPFNGRQNYTLQDNNSARTIIRTNTPYGYMTHVPLNGMNRLILDVNDRRY